MLWKADDLNIERLTWLQGKSSLLLFGPPSAAAARVTHGLTLIEAWIEMKCHIRTAVVACQQIEFKSRCLIIGSALDAQHST